MWYEKMFAVLMEACKYCSLGQLTAAMFEVGGQYRKNIVPSGALTFGSWRSTVAASV